MGKLVLAKHIQWKVTHGYHDIWLQSVCYTGVRSDPELRGVIPNAFDHIFTHILRTENEQFLVRASYLEIYQVQYIIVFLWLEIGKLTPKELYILIQQSSYLVVFAYSN